MTDATLLTLPRRCYAIGDEILQEKQLKKMMNGSDGIAASTSKGNFPPATWNGAQNGYGPLGASNGPVGYPPGYSQQQPNLPPPMYNQPQPQWRPPGPPVPLIPQPQQQRFPAIDRSQLQSPISANGEIKV